LIRPVFISHAGLWCAAGSTPVGIRQALAARQVPTGRLRLLQEDIPYAFASRADRPWQARLEEALAAVGAALDLPGLAPNAALLIGSSSLLIGATEEGGWPHPSGCIMPMDGLEASVRGIWKIDNKGWTFSCGCTSAVHALDAAVGLIESGSLDEALVLGVEILNRTTPAGFASLQLLSATEAKPLDADRSGMVLGEALAAVRLTARPARWRVHSPAMVLDTTSATGHSADGSTIAQAMRTAIEHAGLSPGDLQAIKLQAAGALGTDATEARALKLLFGADCPALLSLKASLGHTLGACGIAELVALLHCGEEGWLPATAGFSRPDPDLGLSPTQEPLPWKRGPILLNIQGFGGGLGSWVVERL
jgi:3-oxoacyl-[acyl-carrier-protein] synthase-1